MKHLNGTGDYCFGEFERLTNEVDGCVVCGCRFGHKLKPPIFSFTSHPIFGAVNKRTWDGTQWVYHCHNGNDIMVTEHEMNEHTNAWLIREGKKEKPAGGYLK